MKIVSHFFIFVLLLNFSSCEKPYLPSKKKNKKEIVIDSEEKEIASNESNDSTFIPENPSLSIEKKDTLANKPSKETCFTVSDFLTRDYLYQIWVKGYIVGSCAKNIKYITLEYPFRGKSAILIADTKNEKDIKKMMAIKIGGYSEVQKELNLIDHPNNFGRKIKVFGYQGYFLNIHGMSSWSSSYEWLNE
jgi:lipoprotein